MFLEKKYAWALIVLLLSFSACGYRFAGSGNLPLGISSIHVNMFANNSRETGFENVITNDIIYEFTRKKKDSITKSDQADGILTGLVSSIRTDTIAREDAGTSLTRRITVSVNVKLTDALLGSRCLWQPHDKIVSLRGAADAHVTRVSVAAG